MREEQAGLLRKGHAIVTSRADRGEIFQKIDSHNLVGGKLEDLPSAK